MFKRKLAFLLLTFLSFCCNASQLSQLYQDACNKDVVYLGEESSHENASAFSLRTEVTQYLVQQCGFNAVFFEAQTYDFIYINKELKSGKLNKQAIEGALGGYVSNTNEVKPLVEFIYDKTIKREIYFAGLDMQTGGRSNLYTQQYLPELAFLLEKPLSEQCFIILNRHLKWLYNEQYPFTSESNRLVANCVESIYQASQTKKDNINKYLAERFYTSLSVFGRQGFSKRSVGMFDSFKWHIAQAPEVNKVIIFGASIHGAKRYELINKEFNTLGGKLLQAYGDQYASYAFVGLDKQTAISTLPDTVKNGEKIVYLLQGDSLESTFDVNLISYNRSLKVDWAKQFDGLIFMPRELSFTKYNNQ